MSTMTNIDYWQKVVENQPASFQRWFAEEKRYLQSIVSPDALVLDVGCGSGRSILDLLPATQKVVGLDHDAKAIADATTIFSAYPSVKLVQADARRIPFENDTFDFVICMGTFANFNESKLEVLCEMRRVLKSSGMCIVSVYSETAFEERMKLYSSVGVKIRQVQGTTVIFDESLGDNISEQFSEQQLKDLFSQAHFEVKAIQKLEIAYICTVSKELS